eukprot:scaffold12282_cov75-Cyclotella_meneghiniana.AAC.3
MVSQRKEQKKGEEATREEKVKKGTYSSLKNSRYCSINALGGSNVGKNLYKKGVLNESKSLEGVTTHPLGTPEEKTYFQKLTYTLAMILGLLVRC